MADAPRITVVIPSTGRRTLERAIRSSRWADEIVVVFDAAAPLRSPRGCAIHAVGPTNDWGGAQRNLGIEVATGTHLAFMDDDDIYTRGAGDVIRATVLAEPGRVHVFRMRNREKVYSGPIASGHISTQMLVVPRHPVGAWTSRYSGDLDFIRETMSLRGDEPVFHPEIIASIRPATFRRTFRAAVSPAMQKRVAGRTWRRLGARMRRRPWP